MGNYILKNHFESDVIQFSQEGAEHTIEVSQWCDVGTLLVSLEAHDEKGAVPEGKEPEISINPGSGTEFSADKRALLATLAGYPRLTTEEEGSEKKLVTVDIEPMLQISEDGWSAKLTIYPPVADTDIPDEQEINRLLSEAGICWGIREKTISSARNTAVNERIPVVGMLVAKGRLPVQGQNGKLRLEVALDVRPGKEQINGSIDYRERNMFVGVGKNQFLAQIISATTGLVGMDIFGNEVPQIPGKELIVKPTPDIIVDETTGEIRAAFAGVVSLVGDSQIKVTSKQMIAEDVDYSTGNISSKSAVEVGGSILPGFVAEAEGDILVKGQVEGGKIVGGANVVIRGGIVGKSAMVVAKADVETPFVEEGLIVSQGGVTVHGGLYFASVQSRNNIICGTSSKVVGSKLMAGGSISLTQVDTETSPHSFIAVATDAKRYAKQQKLLDKIREDEKAIAQQQHRLGPGGGGSELDELMEELAEYRSNLDGYTVVPDVPENDKSAGLRYACRQQITLTGTIQAGAIIRIADTEVVLKQTLQDGCFSLHSEKQQIMFQSKTSGMGMIFL